MKSGMRTKAHRSKTGRVVGGQRRKRVAVAGTGAAASRPQPKTKNKAKRGARDSRKVRGGRSARQAQRQDGCVATLRIVEHVERQADEVLQEYRVDLPSQTRGGRGGENARAGRAVGRSCQAMAAMGHVQRGKIMLKLLEGPATYRTLQKVTKLLAGPLYHHINQLRMAGLILPKQRDLYEMTRGGRNLVLAAVLLGPLIGDRRRRPLGVAE